MLRQIISAILLPFCIVWLVASTPSSAILIGNLHSIDSRLEQAKPQMPIDPAAVLKVAQDADRELTAMRWTPDLALVLAKARWLEAEANLRIGYPERAEPLIDSGLAILGKGSKPTKIKADLLTSRGYLETAKADFAGALRDYQTSYKIYVNLENPRGQSIALQNIASLYREANDLQNAIKYDNESGKIYKNDTSLSLSMHNNNGNAYAQMHKFSDADREYRAAVTLAKKMGSTLLHVKILANMAKNRVNAGWNDAAKPPLTQAWRLANSSEEATIWNPQLKAIEAELARKEGHYTDAARLIERAFAEAGDNGPTLSYHDAHETAYQLYKQLGRNDLALPHLEALKQLDDQAASLAASANNALMAARFDFTNQNLRIAQLQAQDLQRKVAYERARTRTVRLAFISAGGVTIIIIAMLVFGIVIIRRSRNEERAAKDALAETNSALAKALAAKTEFLATTSHEIRTPLNGILGMTQVMLADPKLAADTRERLGVVQSAGVTMRALVDDILDVAKMETGNMTIEHAPMDVCQVLTDVARVWRDQAEDRGIAFVLSVDECPARVMGDAARLRQVVFNLLSNALKFTERGRIELGGSVVETERGRRVRITVTDTGIGIAPDKIDEVFESFRQADASTTRRFGGTGLGLAICRSLARAMDGDVSVESRLGEGTIFTVELPLIHAEEEPIACDEPSGASLLIVDRNPITRSMLRALLEERAGAVHLAGSIDDARVLLASGNVGNVLIDESAIRCVGDGWRVALTGLVEAATEATHFTALWRLDDPAEATTIAAVGIDQLIEKPVAGPVLRDALYPINATKRGNEGDTVLVSNAA